MPSYPAAPVVFPARSDGQTIYSQHVNAIQDEIAALEASLVGGTLPSPQRIGSSARPTLILDPGGLRQGRLFSSIQQTLLAHNLSTDGTSWNLDDPAQAGSLLALTPVSGMINMYYAAPGANPRPLVQIFQVDSVGALTVPGGLSVGGALSLASLALSGGLTAATINTTGNINSSAGVGAAAGFFERGRIVADGSQQAYTPTWGSNGVAPVLGNGTSVGFWWELGWNLVYFSIVVTLGTTSTPGYNAMLFSLPPTRAESGAYFLANAVMTHGGATYFCQAFSAGGSRVQLRYQSSLTATGQVTAGVPYVPGNGDTYSISGAYSAL